MKMKATLPEQYLGLDPKAMAERIEAHRTRLGSELVILGHHYQKDDVICHSDHRGDSFQLAQVASEQSAKWIVFCGVEFMADSARILAREEQVVLHPDQSAGCPMADMAGLQDVEKAWQNLGEILETCDDLIPVTYMNSDAETKAFCGRHGGIVCTSSNADAVFDWAFARGSRLLFLPDEHLGRNTAWARDLRGSAVQLYDASQAQGGLSAEEIRTAKVLLWKGFCHVHTHFSSASIQKARQANPQALVVVHPECPREIVALADASGSTGFILDYCAKADPGSTIYVGTELNLCQRVAADHPDKSIHHLGRSICPNMWKISPNDLLWTLDYLGEVNVVHVEPALAADAKLALERMLSL
jgi:quinolinate synthase